MAKKHCYWVAPGMVAAVLLSIYAAYGLFPFGTGTISWCDMNQQVIPFLMDFKNILAGKADMFLNLQNAGGMSFWGVFLFFISSPFSFLVALVDKAQIYCWINVLLLLKMMVCALTAGCFFVHRFPRLGWLQISALSVMYAFCGYTMFYYQNIVWLDMMYLFPLLLLALSRLAEEGKPLFYTLVFTAILTVNFYLTYMVVIFLILASGIYLITCVPEKERREKIVIFGFSTLVSGMLTCVVWLPSLLQYIASARTGDLISSLRSGNLLTHLDTTVPVILCTGAIAAAVAMAFMLRKTRENRVRWTMLMLLLTLIPIFIEPINKMWQTGSYQSFPVRYGYMPVFLGLILLAGCISKLNVEEGKQTSGKDTVVSVVISTCAVFAVIFCAGIILKYNFQEVSIYTKTLWGSSQSLYRLLLFSVAVSFVYMILLLQYYYRQLRRGIFTVFLCMLAMVEAAFYSNVYIASAKSNAQYYGPILDLGERISDDSFYRVKMNDKYFDVNLMGGMGYRSLSHYTSLTSKDYMFGMKKLGYSSYWMEVNSNGGTKLTDAVLGNKYSIVRTDSLSQNKKTVYSNGLYSIVQNENSLPMGLVMKSGKIETLGKLPNTTRLLTQQYLFQSIFSSSRELFEQYDPTVLDNVEFTAKKPFNLKIQDMAYEGTVLYRIPVSGTQTLYFDCFDQLSNRLQEHINSSFSITVNGKILDIQYPTQSCNGLYRLGTFTNETVEVEIGVLRNVSATSFGVAGLRDDVLSEAVAGAAKANLSQNGNRIVGTAAASGDNNYLFLPVSYSKGYSASVNGRPAKISRVFDTFMAVKLEKGNNRIEISYVPDGFFPGLVVTLAGVGGLFLLLHAGKKEWFRRAKRLQAFAEVVFTLLFLFILAAIYVFPVVTYLV